MTLKNKGISIKTKQQQKKNQPKLNRRRKEKAYGFGSVNDVKRDF